MCSHVRASVFRSGVRTWRGAVQPRVSVRSRERREHVRGPFRCLLGTPWLACCGSDTSQASAERDLAVWRPTVLGCKDYHSEIGRSGRL